MNYPYLPERAAASSELHCSDSGPSDMLNGMTTANVSLPPESKTESCPTPLSSAMSKHSSVTGTPKAIREWLVSLPPDSRASRSVSPASKSTPQTKGICGPIQPMLSGLSAPDSYCLKMCPVSASTCPWLSETCADLGMKFQDPSSLGLTTSAPRTEEKESGCWPTPHGFSKDGRSNGPSGNELGRAVNRSIFPTPSVAAAIQGVNESDGKRGQTLLGAARMQLWPTPQAENFRSRGGKRKTEDGSGLGQSCEDVANTEGDAVRSGPCPDESGEIGRGRSGDGSCQREISDTDMRRCRQFDAPDFAARSGQSAGVFIASGACAGWPVEPDVGRVAWWTDLKPLVMDRFREWWQQHGGY